ncbi:MAG: hypothetical protein ACN4E2_04510 [Nitrospinota bacterium]
MSIDTLVILVHIFFGTAFLFTMIVTQLVIKDIMGLFPESEKKESAKKIMGRRIRGSMDATIIIMTITALYFLHSRLDLLFASNILFVKALVGGSALLIALFLHFVLRPIKVRAIASGNKNRMMVLNKLAPRLERTAMFFAFITVLLAIYFNHG